MTLLDTLLGMSIWFKAFDLSDVNSFSKQTLIEHLNIEFTEIGSDYLQAQMPVDSRTHQPVGILHGGASCVLAETVGSTAANFCVNPEKYYCVGLDINTNHVRPIRSGKVIATGKPFHLGKMTQVWNIEIVNEQQQLISISRLTVMILTQPQG